jgi:Leucine-rich repeat (LRR) protein
LEKGKHSITVLDLHNNKLDQIPNSVYELYKLKTLIVSNNNLNNLDARLSILPDLVRISIEGNPLRSVKPSLRSANAV